MGMKINCSLPAPEEIKAEYPLSEELASLKNRRDKEIKDVIAGRSDKFLVIVGPCSADREDSVLEYTEKLARLAEKLGDRLVIIPRYIRTSRARRAKATKACSTSPDLRTLQTSDRG